jgi:hypothetical protein
VKLSGLMRTAAAIVWLTPLCGAAAEDSVQFSSGPAQVTLLELYTSQGCSSCPPAERWLNRYVDDSDLWTRIVPVAFHVDYWDALGWKDPYAAAEHGTRPRAYARAGRAGGVYTPGLFVNGREWRGWIFALPPRASDREPGILEMRITRDRLDAAFPAQGRVLDLHVARLGFGIETRVLRGENGNRVLPQEFVVLAHAVFPADDGRWHVPLPCARDGAVRREAVAAWVSEAGDPAPLQTTGGWLPEALLE